MESIKKIKSFFGRTGGKHFSKKDIIPFIKDLEYKTYCEPFVGAGSIFLGREKKAEIEVINDFDPLVINLWKGMKECGSELKDYTLYFQDKSVFKWYLLKEKQNRRMKKQQEIKDIETFKEDLFITNKSFSQNNTAPNIKVCEKGKSIYTTKHYREEYKIETLKEDIFITKLSRYQCGTRIDINNTPRKVCSCVKSNETVRRKTQELNIETLKEDLFISSNSFSQNSERPNINRVSSNSSLEIVNTRSNVKILNIETLKEDLFITQHSRMSNMIYPDQKIKHNNNCSCLKDKKLNKNIETIEDIIEEEKEDLEVCCNIEKTEEGLKLVKKKYYVRNKKYSGDETKWRLHNPNLCGWHNILKNCDKYQERLKDTFIYQGDYRKMIDMYDNEDTLFYFDAPWTKTASGKKGNKCYSGWVELQDFYNSVKDIKGKWLASYNNDPEILETFKDYRIEYINTTYTQRKAGDKKVVDILIMNFGLEDDVEEI